jgi:hypothetical protein
MKITVQISIQFDEGQGAVFQQVAADIQPSRCRCELRTRHPAPGLVVARAGAVLTRPANFFRLIRSSPYACPLENRRILL